ncbi:unnamed protein product [Mesocestoides corti]|uniref:Uncharacterized protein n=1 Tax=Mesocestoides corti TaxID=53468 RepID=A0A0R3U7T6_MESCO|nr:unnamed protein product [Mesocestoides corti]
MRVVINLLGDQVRERSSKSRSRSKESRFKEEEDDNFRIVRKTHKKPKKSVKERGSRSRRSSTCSENDRGTCDYPILTVVLRQDAGEKRSRGRSGSGEGGGKMRSRRAKSTSSRTSRSPSKAVEVFYRVAEVENGKDRRYKY